MPNTEYSASGPRLENGQIIPAFTLPGPDGMPYSPWDYKQREHLILLFVQSALKLEARNLLEAFARQYANFREEHCSLLTITPEPVITNLQAQEELRLPFPLLADPQGQVIKRYTHWESEIRILSPCLVLADRYGALYQQWIATDEAALPPIAELLASLSYLNRLCTP